MTKSFSFQTHPGSDVTKVKELFAQTFPDVASSTSTDGDDTKWFESVLENLKLQLVSNKTSLNNTASTNTSPIANNNNQTNNNHLNNCSDVETNNLNNSAVNGDSNSSTSSNAENELVLLQNAQLKTTVEEYKNIIAETVSWILHVDSWDVCLGFVLQFQESMLKNLESKVREQDAYWTKVVLMKDSEIDNLKTVSEKSWAGIWR